MKCQVFWTVKISTRLWCLICINNNGDFTTPRKDDEAMQNREEKPLFPSSHGYGLN
jgi:hypothetical protein